MRGIYYSILAVSILFSIVSITLYLLSTQVTLIINKDIVGWITALATTAAVFIALFGKEMREFIFPSNIKIVSPKENLQIPNPELHASTQGHTRLLVKNFGKTSAYDVEVYVTKLTDPDCIREDFLPVPLCWTHNGLKRSFHPNQFGYLDLCRIDKRGDYPKLALIPGAGVFNYETILEGTTILELTTFEASGKVKIYNVTLNWKPGMEIVNVISIVPLTEN